MQLEVNLLVLSKPYHKSIVKIEKAKSSIQHASSFSFVQTLENAPFCCLVQVL